MPASLEPLDIGVQIPLYFRCPISLELMRDPVTVCTGQTYDRSSIESWVATGNTTCPVTRSPLSDFTLIPNHTLRRLIQDWCVTNRDSGVERIPTPKQPADPLLVRSLLARAASASGGFGPRSAALRRLRGLARDSEKNRAVIAASGAREILLPIAFDGAADPGLTEEEEELSREALAVVSALALSEPDCEYVARDPGRVGYLVSLMFHPSIDVRVSSAAAIEAVVGGLRSPELRSRVSGADGAFDGVVGVLSNPLACPRAARAGVRALFALCLAKRHRHRAVAAGAAEALVDGLAAGVLERCDVERALATAELLCRVPAGRAAFGAHALAVPLLVRTILKVSDRATEYAAGALLSVCAASERSRREAASAGVVTQLLLVVQSGCTERAKRKAQILLKLLRESWPRDSSLAKSDEFAGTDVVLF